MIVSVDVTKTPDGQLFEQRLAELSKLTVRVGYQRGEGEYDPGEVEKIHAKNRAKKKKSKGASKDVNPYDALLFDSSPKATRHGGESAKDKKVDMLDVVMWNELGTVRSPSRPFLRMSVDENKDKITNFKQFAMLKITTEQLLGLVGNFQVGLVQRKIRDGKYVPNAPSTIARKGSDKPLIDTGRMRQSVHFQIMTNELAATYDAESIE